MSRYGAISDTFPTVGGVVIFIPYSEMVYGKSEGFLGSPAGNTQVPLLQFLSTTWRGLSLSLHLSHAKIVCFFYLLTSFASDANEFRSSSGCACQLQRGSDEISLR